MSPKLVRRGDHLFIGWLDAPEAAGAPAQIRLGVCDVASGALLQIQTLGAGIDNHCGPALALDSNNRLHAMIGAHHGPFLYRWSDHPADPDSWSAPEPLGPRNTYPSLVVDFEGTLHLLYRESGDFWRLEYRRRRPGAAWETPVPLAISPVPGYNHFMQSLSVGPTGHLHAVFQFHFGPTGHGADCRGRAVIYLRSKDGGDTWTYDDGIRPVLPIEFASAQTLCRYEPSAGLHSLRVGPHTVDRDDRLWFYCSVPDAMGLLYTNHSGDWERRDLSALTNGLDYSGGRSSAFSQAPNGDLHLLISCSPAGPTAWYDPALELYHLHLDAQGGRKAFRQLSITDPDRAQWLPAIEQWDWTRPQACCNDDPFYAITRGINAGGIGGNNTNALQTDVWLGRL